MSYECVIGLEVHVELNTKSKIFCSCSTQFGGAPNTHVCPVCLGLPGALPVLNKEVVASAIKAGLALNCAITENGRQDRKNYFYPDLPKAYQISQSDLPIALGGFLNIETSKGLKKVGITRVHIEEDAGKLIHEKTGGTLIDYNRGGVPLIEIVSEPDMRSAEEVKAYLQKLRATMLYLGISSCKMNEGAFRCDVNLSVRKVGSQTLGTRTEMKNLNSFAFIMKAIESEKARQIAILEGGGVIDQETRRWDALKNQSFSMRSKEDAHDYRYFPDPDLKPIVIKTEEIQAIKSAMPQLPEDYRQLFLERYGIKGDVSEQLVKDKAIADYFSEGANMTKSPEIFANLLIMEVSKFIESGSENVMIPIEHKYFAELVNLVSETKINLGIAKKVLSAMWLVSKSPLTILDEKGWWPIVDREVLLGLGREILKKTPQIASDYRSGKKQALGAFMGQLMKATEGKADPTISEEIFVSQLVDEF
ncbi:Asp-tRNA(Asn)/Glu-tRNA(Gln) amidotransferase subunit GatB [Fusibacter bizertensis]